MSMAATSGPVAPVSPPPQAAPPQPRKNSSPLQHAQFPQRRQRCISCSDSGNYLDLSLEGVDVSSAAAADGEADPVPLPDVIVTRRNRSDSVCGRIFDDVETGLVKYFCRSRGHGFVKPDSVSTGHA